MYRSSGIYISSLVFLEFLMIFIKNCRFTGGTHFCNLLTFLPFSYKKTCCFNGTLASSPDVEIGKSLFCLSSVIIFSQWESIQRKKTHFVLKQDMEQGLSL